MVANNNTQTQTASALAALLLVLGFSLSSGTQGKVMSRDLASTSKCSIADQLEAGANEAECIVEQIVDGEKVSGTIKVFVGEQKKFKRDPSNPTQGTTEVQQVLRVETEAQICESCGTVSDSTPLPISKLLDGARDIERMAQSRFANNAKEAAARIKENKDQKRNEDLCLEDANGKIEAGPKRIHCRIQKMAMMDDEQAAQFYDNYIKGDIQDLIKTCEASGVVPSGNRAVISANCKRDLENAKKLMGYALEGAESNQYIKASVTEMAEFTKAVEKMKNLEVGIAGAQGNPQLQQQYREELQSLKQAWAPYYSNGGSLASQQLDMSHWSYSGTLANDLATYNAYLDATYSQILNGAGINSSNSNGQVGTGRLGRTQQQIVNPWSNNPHTGTTGTPTQNLGQNGQFPLNVPSYMQPSQNPALQQQQQFQQQPQLQQRVGPGRIPMAGQPVR